MWLCSTWSTWKGLMRLWWLSAELAGVSVMHKGGIRGVFYYVAKKGRR